MKFKFKSIFCLHLLLLIFSLNTSASCPTEPIQPNTTFPELTLTTNLGDVVIELDRGRAPLTVNHFLHLIETKAFDNNLVHRVVPDYVIQTGAFKTDYSAVTSCGTLFNESGNGLRNERGTLAMARHNDPHSATSSFFINLKDNDNLNPNDKTWGYTVFGYVVSGMEVVDQMAQAKTAYNKTMDAKNVPVKPIIITSVRLNQ